MKYNRFRGKGNPKYNDGGWYYGDLIMDSDGDYQISYKGLVRVTVLNNTIGQYIDQEDCNDNQIYEGDFVRNVGDDDYGLILFDENDSMYVISYDGFEVNFGTVWGKDLEIIGNIYDNPELIQDWMKIYI